LYACPDKKAAKVKPDGLTMMTNLKEPMKARVSARFLSFLIAVVVCPPAELLLTQ